MDKVSLTYAVLGGLCHGTYPLFLKLPKALEEKPHPLAWTFYKAIFLLLLGVSFVLKNRVYLFSWWGIFCGMAWVPASVCMNAAVPRIGIALAASIEPGIVTTLSFLIGCTLLGEQMKSTQMFGMMIPLAPIFMVAIVTGIACIAMSPFLKCGATHDVVGKMTDGSDKVDLWHKSAESKLCNPDAEAAEIANNDANSLSIATHARVFGLIFTMLTGIFATAQYCAVNIGQMVVQNSHKCSIKENTCGMSVTERFDNAGSFTLSFGIGAILVWMVYWLIFSALSKAKGGFAVSLHFRSLGLHACALGFIWAVGVFFCDSAVERGGSAVMTPIIKGVQVIVAGLWGILLFQECRGYQIVFWGVAVIWTVGFMTALGHQKV